MDACLLIHCTKTWMGIRRSGLRFILTLTSALSPRQMAANWPCYRVKRTFLTRMVRMDKRFVSFTFGAVLLSYQCFINSLIEPRAEKKNEPQEWREWTRDLSLLPFGFCLATNVSFFQLVRKV